MKRTQFMALALLLLARGPAMSQESKTPPPNLGLHILIAVPAVQEELKLTDAQKKALDDLSAESKQALRGSGKLERAERQKKFREVNQNVRKHLNNTLKEEQQTRLNQIDLQQRGPLAANQRKIAQDLGLSDDQKEKLRKISQDVTASVQKLREANKGEELAEKIGKVRVEATAKVMEVLTAEQKKAWKEMLGKPIDLSKLQPK